VLDAGNFIAHLTEQSLRQAGGSEALAHHEQTIQEELCAGSDPATRVVLRDYVTLAFVRHIHISTCIPERHPYTEAILEICERRLDISHRLPQRHL